MQSHYDILGIATDASSEQIKAAFRRLAKIYHPDKNPQGNEQFGKILLAYEILVNTSSRQQYDSKLKHGNAENFKAKKTNQSKQKEWSFSDEEIKRRQYYKEHYKKEYERYAKEASVTRKNYNEYKYILFAAPLAVGLLMFIVNTYEQSAGGEIKKPIPVEREKYEVLKTTDDPFTAYFGNETFDTAANRTFAINNLSTKEIVVVMFDVKNKFLRSMVIVPGFRATVEQLPNSDMNLKLLSGKNWNKQKAHKGFDVIGGFSDNESYCILNTQKTNGYTITLDEETLSALDKIEEKELFKRD